MTAIKKQASTAGVLYFLVLLIAPIGLVYVPGKLYVRENATATADHIRNCDADPGRIGFRADRFSQCAH